MIATLRFALAAAICLVTGEASTAALARPAFLHATLPADSTYRQLFETGEAFPDFVSRADRRKEQWERNYAGAATDALVARVTKAGSGWRLLVVTVPGCSDSVNSVPYLASLVERLPGVQMRLINSSAGRAVMEAHRTPDGRPATPTVILLDESFNERGCWIERPASLLAWMAEQQGKVSDTDLFDGKMKWYDVDRGASSLDEIVAMIEAAARGERRCGSTS